MRATPWMFDHGMPPLCALRSGVGTGPDEAAVSALPSRQYVQILLQSQCTWVLRPLGPNARDPLRVEVGGLGGGCQSGPHLRNRWLCG